MKTKSRIVLAAIALLIMVGTITMPASAEYTTTRYISTGQEIAFMLHGSDGETVKVYYYPHEAGTRKFEAWHNTIYYWDKVAAMTFSWTDNEGQTWHEWRNAPVGYYWPKVEQDLYSGSSNIGYKFEFKILPAMCYDVPGSNCDTPDALNIHVKIQ